MTIYDVFMFNGEDDQLTMRMEELAPLDPIHIAVQGDRTFQGEWRDWSTTPDRVRDYFTRLPGDADSWGREAYQRNASMTAVPDARQDDFVIVSDADEIPRASVVDRLTCCGGGAVPTGELVALRMPYLYFGLDWLVPWDHSLWPVLARVETIRQVSPQYARYHPTAWVRDAGWHPTHQGGPDRVLEKFRSFAHTELLSVTREQLVDCIVNGKDYEDPPRGDLIPVEIDETYPRCVYEHPERWEHMTRKYWRKRLEGENVR